jgi:hypothetical protein
MSADGGALFEYVYEFRRGEEILATGHLGRDEPLDVGDKLEIAGQTGLVSRVEPRLGKPALHVIIEATAD